MGDGSGEWFEITNISGAAVDLDGLQVSDTGGAAFTVSGTVAITAGGSVVLGNNADPLTNGV